MSASLSLPNNNNNKAAFDPIYIKTLNWHVKVWYQAFWRERLSCRTRATWQLVQEKRRRAFRLSIIKSNQVLRLNCCVLSGHCDTFWTQIWNLCSLLLKLVILFFFRLNLKPLFMQLNWTSHTQYLEIWLINTRILPVGSVVLQLISEWIREPWNVTDIWTLSLIHFLASSSWEGKRAGETFRHSYK